MRINKYLAECGLGSRRACEQLVLDGRVAVNGKTADKLAFEINPENDKVSLDGKKVRPILKHLYIAFHKPKGCVTTTSDDKGRKTVIDYLPAKYKEKRIFPVGRLDYETEGLILLTTDGDTANRVMHPRHELAKTYAARLESDITEAELEKLRRGVELDGEKTKKCKVRRLESEEGQARIEVVISEGRNRQVRRMFEAVGKNVTFLKRTAIGEIRLGGLGRGECRELKTHEIEFLKRF
ncbi:MAG: rRNA pseudouridine synthase [Firmicutes bacterium]|nr:rRNA pseudouridine synthase [Bacillota bacterium]